MITFSDDGGVPRLKVGTYMKSLTAVLALSMMVKSCRELCR